MRLVDANELKHEIVGTIPMMATVRIPIEHKIDAAPTVDAIPVEWLEAQIRPYTGDVSDIGKSAANGTIKGIIRKWQKEQEAQDG